MAEQKTSAMRTVRATERSRASRAHDRMKQQDRATRRAVRALKGKAA